MNLSAQTTLEKLRAVRDGDPLALTDVLSCPQKDAENSAIVSRVGLSTVVRERRSTSSTDWDPQAVDNT